MTPFYYQKNGIEVLDIIDAFELDFYLGNVIKYVLRFNRKSTGDVALQDLRKAQDYLQKFINKERKRLEKEEG